MFRIASRPFASRHGTRGALATRLFHRITTDFVTHDTKGNQVTEKVPAVICNPGESYVMIEPRVGNALRAASPSTASSPGPAGDKCKLKFFHDSRHFASDASGYPRLHVPVEMPRQTGLDSSLATLYLSGDMHEIVLDGTPDAEFSEHAHTSAKNLAPVLEQLKDM